MLIDDYSHAHFIDSEFVNNTATNGGIVSRGGALSLWTGSSLVLINCSLRGNVASFGGKSSEGGGFVLQESSLTAVNCNLSGNVALGGSVSRGGLISVLAPSVATFESSQLVGNAVKLGTLESLGGALYAESGKSSINIVSGRLVGNQATSNSISRGGGLYLGPQVTLRLSHLEMNENHAQGGSAEGGAVWSAGLSLYAENFTSSGNYVLADGVDKSALGGAFFCQAGSSELVDGKLTANVARIANPALRASSGAVHVANGATVKLQSCVFRNNMAGGNGKLQGAPEFYPAGLTELFESSALHLFSEGNLVLQDCLMTDATVAADGEPFGSISVLDAGDVHSMWFWVVVQGGLMSANQSRFHATAACSYDCKSNPPPDAGPYCKFMNIRSPTAQVVIRGCSMTNLTLKSTVAMKVPIAIVNSTLQPPWNPDLLPYVVQPDPDHCGIKVAGSSVCDPRAECATRPSGGIVCTCDGKNLRTKKGSYPDGHECQREAVMDVFIQSKAVTLKAQKPGNYSDRVHFLVRAEGEVSFNATYSIHAMQNIAAIDPRSTSNSSNSPLDLSRLDQPEINFHGIRVIWDTPPATATEMQLDASSGLFVASKEFSFQLQVDCRGESAGLCVGDGDVVDFNFTVSSSATVFSAVYLTTQIQSLASCEHTKVLIDDEITTIATYVAIQMHLLAYDVDGLPINYTRSEVEFSFDQKLLPVKWDRGSNKYLSEVSADLNSQVGDFEIVVSLNNGWSNLDRTTKRCELLRRQLSVTNRSQTIVGIVLGGIMLATLGALVFAVLKNRVRLAQPQPPKLTLS